MKTKLIAGLVVLALVATAVGVISARNNFGAQLPPQWTRGSGWMNQSKYNITSPCGNMSQLTEEQRQEVRQKIQEFRQGQRQEAQEFMQQICDQYKITCPSGPKFVDEDGTGINDTMGPHGWRYWRGPGF
jgi:Spy/CpxP family protein refolding chaperone